MIKIKAKIYIYKHKAKKSFFVDGYRPAFCFDEDKSNFFTGHIELINQDKFDKGTLSDVYITFTNKNLVTNYIKIGQTFSINEPPNEIGEGEIIEIFR